MKKIITVILIVSSITQFSWAQKIKVKTVNNAKEFIKAIAPNTTIQLKGATIYLSELSSDNSGDYYRFNKEYDGYELVIQNVDNFKIQGLGETPVKIITKPVYGDVLVFENCNNIILENIDAGHGPEKGGCTGGVLNFINSNEISINNSIMFGSGMEGITAFKVTGLECNNSIIRGCTYSIMTLTDCRNFEFSNCEFSDNQEFDLINIFKSQNIKFLNCDISNNRTGTESYSDYSVFKIGTSTGVELKNSSVTSNKSVHFCSDESALEIKKTEFGNNHFDRGKFKE